MKIEKIAEYYDIAYSKNLSSNGEYAKSPVDSIYFPIWKYVIDNISSDNNVIDIGCGVGQFAQLCSMSNIRYVLGIDYSKVAIENCKKLLLKYNFIQADLYDIDFYSLPTFDIIVCCEVFEHLQNDLDVIKNMPFGQKIIFTVPNFDCESHIRTFQSEKEILDHYGKHIKFSSIKPFKLSEKQTIFACIGTKRPNIDFLCIMTAYNEEKMLPYKIRYCKKNGMKLHIIDNMSTDNTWKILEEYNISRSKVDTNEIFDLKLLQKAMNEKIHEISPDWVHYNGCDLFIVGNMPFCDLVWRIDKLGYNLLGTHFYDVRNTREEPPVDGNFIDTYFYYMQKNDLYMTFKYEKHTFNSLAGDGVDFKGKCPEKMKLVEDFIMLNYGMTKSKAERDETLKRRQKAWDNGLKPNIGRHYRSAANLNWTWDKNTLADLRNTNYIECIKKYI